ncbi:MAG TPA: KOW domain-containing RNA-binding protein [Clostridia bacterium]|nr:KOW domain-containing RNA-binding protein [Clostridia bacterium]
MKKPFPMEVGRVVFSKAGRDSGRYHIIVEVLDDQYVAIVDGRTRKLASPKKKKVRHLQPTVECFTSVREKLQSGQLLDAHVRKCLDDAGYACKEG